MARTDPATNWPPPPYSGVKFDSGAFKAMVCGAPPPYSFYGVLILDVPFSFVCDTFILPTDYYTRHKNDHEKSVCIEFSNQLEQNSDTNSHGFWYVCEFKLDKAIRDDSRNFIQGLPSEQRSSAHCTYSLGDETGEHAVEIVTFLDGVRWKYILIYDRENKRRKEIKFTSGIP